MEEFNQEAFRQMPYFGYYSGAVFFFIVSAALGMAGAMMNTAITDKNKFDKSFITFCGAGFILSGILSVVLFVCGIIAWATMEV